jgi:hypothetical protein
MIVAPPDRREARTGLGPGLPEIERRLEEEHARAGRGDLNRAEACGVDVVGPGAADAEIADVESRVVHREDGALLLEGSDRPLDRDAGLADLVIDEERRADPVRVPVVRRELDAGEEQELPRATLRVGHEVEL